ncbi:hypothetical protein MASR2M12_23470 [Bacteroidales bacterium]
MGQTKNKPEQGSIQATNLHKRRVRIAARVVFYSSLFLSVILSSVVFQKQAQLQEKAMLYLRSEMPELSIETKAGSSPKKQLEGLQANLTTTEKALKAFYPLQSFIVINTTSNTFNLYDKDGNKLRNGLVSTGSFTVLKAGDNKQWMFKTPRGQLKVLRKTKDPVWKRPDWAFIEEGLKVPSPNHPSRFEYGTLGDYSISLGDGYLIHGTLYKRFLGLPVTHGCVRMGDDDLEAVFNNLKIGSKVYIY